jgi:hypothetical protein
LSRDPSGVWGGSEIRGNIARRELLGASVGERETRYLERKADPQVPSSRSGPAGQPFQMAGEGGVAWALCGGK